MGLFPPPRVIRKGEAKPHPFTILVVANPVYEIVSALNLGTGTPQADPIMSLPGDFDKCVEYVEQSLFKGLVGQLEVPLKDPGLGTKVRLLSLFHNVLPPVQQNCFVSYSRDYQLLISRRDVINSFLNAEEIQADIVFAVSGYESPEIGSPNRSTAYAATDDENSAGVSFMVDNKMYKHYASSSIPGTIALAYKARSLTAPHELMHAIGSFQNLKVSDLYTNTQAQGSINQRIGAPRPPIFANYQNNAFNSDPVFPLDKTAYHCERVNLRRSIMDNYFDSKDGGLDCANDRITRQFFTDRILCKLSR